MSSLEQDNATGNLTAAANDNSRNAYTSPHSLRKMFRQLNELKRGLKTAPSACDSLTYEFARNFVPALIQPAELKATILQILPGSDELAIDQAIQRGVDEPSVARVTALATNLTGEPYSSQANVNLCIENMLEVCPVLVHNRREQQLWVVHGTPPWAPRADNRLAPRRLDDADLTQLCTLLSDEYRVRSATPEQVSKAIKSFAGSLHQWDPVVDYLIEQRDAWQGTNDEARELLETVLIRHAGAENGVHTRAVTRCWLLIAAKRALEPGCQYRQVLTLVGPQWVGKSSFFNALVDESNWYLDDVPVERGNDNVVRKLRGKWIVELPEVDKLLKADRTGEIKSFISTRTDTIKPLYAEYAIDRPRDCVFGATTNEEQFFHDATGNSRFDVVRVGKIDHEAVAAERDRIWGAAMVLLAAGAQPFLTDEEQVLARGRQDEHYAKPAAAELIAELVEGPAPVCHCLTCIRAQNGRSGPTGSSRTEQCTGTWHPDQRLREGWLRDDCVDEEAEKTELRLVWVGTLQLRSWLHEKGERTTPQVIANTMRALGWRSISTPRKYRAKVGRRIWCHPAFEDFLRE